MHTCIHTYILYIYDRTVYAHKSMIASFIFASNDSNDSVYARLHVHVHTSIACVTYIHIYISEYEELCVNLAEDSERLFYLRNLLESRRKSCALFDTNRVRAIDTYIHAY